MTWIESGSSRWSKPDREPRFSYACRSVRSCEGTRRPCEGASSSDPSARPGPDNADPREASPTFRCRRAKALKNQFDRVGSQGGGGIELAHPLSAMRCPRLVFGDEMLAGYGTLI